MAKEKVNKKNEFADDDNDIEQDMKTLGQVRDDLLKVYKTSISITEKISIAAALTGIVKSREEAELFLLRVMDYFDNNNDEDEYCEGCPECDPKMKVKDEGEVN